MTPSLMGRWQTRIALLGTLGLLITVLYMWIFGFLGNANFWTLPLVLGYVALFGLVWDLIYTYFQGFRWDRDWPLSFVFCQGIVEGILVFILFRFNLLPGLTYHDGDLIRFVLDYGTVWLVTYWWLFGPMRILFPRWRFKGGELF